MTAIELISLKIGDKVFICRTQFIKQAGHLNEDYNGGLVVVEVDGEYITFANPRGNRWEVSIYYRNLNCIVKDE